MVFAESIPVSSAAGQVKKTRPSRRRPSRITKTSSREVATGASSAGGASQASQMICEIEIEGEEG